HRASGHLLGGYMGDWPRLECRNADLQITDEPHQPLEKLSRTHAHLPPAKVQRHGLHRCCCVGNHWSTQGLVSHCCKIRSIVARHSLIGISCTRFGASANGNTPGARTNVQRAWCVTST